MTQTIAPSGPAAARVLAAFRPAATALLYGLRLTAAVGLALTLAFWLQLDDPSWAGTSAGIVCQPILGASIRKGVFRLVGTVIGATATVILTAVFPQDRVGFFFGLALWSAACSFVSTSLRNFAAYAAMLAGYTMSIIAGSTLAAPDTVFEVAVSRASEIIIGIVCGMLVMSLTEFGSSARRLAGAMGTIYTDILAGLAHELAPAPGRHGPSSSPRRRELVRQTIALDPIQDQAIGESSDVGARRSVLRGGIDGLFVALAAWRSIQVHLDGLPPAESSALAALIKSAIPNAAALPEGQAALAAGRLITIRQGLATAALAARTLPADTPSQRLGLDRLATLMEGLARAANGMLLTVDPRRVERAAALPVTLMADPLPPLVNAIRVFVAMTAAILFYVATSWSAGPQFLTFVAVTVILLSPQDEAAGKASLGFGVGTVLAACLAGAVKFALLPNHESPFALVGIMGVVLVPLAALSTRPALAPFLVPAVMNFVPLLGPTNEISFDTVAFYNSALAIVGGCAGGALILQLIPPVPPAERARRLLRLTRRDLRRLARDPGRWSADRWRSRVFARLTALPADADLADGARLLAALTVGLRFLHLSRTANAGGFARALATGDLAAARAAADALSREPTPAEEPARQAHLRRVGAAWDLAETLGAHPRYFAGAA